MTDFTDFEWVVWRLEVQDPYQLAGKEPDLHERTRETMTELAASLGCVYDHCVDDDSYDNGTPYYAWWVRLPAAEHARARRDKDGLPPAIAPLRQYLTTQLPGDLTWEITPDRELTYDHAGSVALRTAYDDLIAPIERALMPLRRDGADALDPRAKVWTWQGDLVVGTFDLWLCDDPDRPHTWIVVTAGLWTQPQLFDEEPAACLGHGDFTPHHPLLFLPRPPGAGDVHRPRGVRLLPPQEHLQDEGGRSRRNSPPVDGHRPRRSGRPGCSRPHVAVAAPHPPGKKVTRPPSHAKTPRSTAMADTPVPGCAATARKTPGP